jgi:hypothetical protein
MFDWTRTNKRECWYGGEEQLTASDEGDSHIVGVHFDDVSTTSKASGLTMIMLMLVVLMLHYRPAPSLLYTSSLRTTAPSQFLYSQYYASICHV